MTTTSSNVTLINTAAQTEHGATPTNIATSFNETATVCPDCRETPGWRYVNAAQKAVTRCHCRFVSGDVKVRSILPPLLHGARLSDFAQPLAAAVRRWLEKPTQGLFITGGVGTGKTWLCGGVVRALVDRGGAMSSRVAFKLASDFYAEIRATYANPGVTEIAILNQFGNVDFLVLDDLGAGSMTDFERRSTLHMLDCRLNNLHPTVITSNLSLVQIAQRMDERIASRLMSFTRIAMTGRDRRGRA